MRMVKPLIVSIISTGLIGVAQVDPVTAGGKLSQLGALGILGTCLIAVTLALVKKDRRADILSDTQAAAAREMAAALQASTDVARTQNALSVEVKDALRENTSASREMSKAASWCEQVHRRIVPQ
jgi:hypothetical protein